jgi:hypothetical protein
MGRKNGKSGYILNGKDGKSEYILNGKSEYILVDYKRCVPPNF